MVTNLHDYEAENLLRNIFINHVREIAGDAYRMQRSISIYPFSLNTRDIVSVFLADFEKKVLIRHGVKGDTNG